MPHNRLPRVMRHYSPTGRGIMADLYRDFWIRETRTGQQMAQLHDIYDDDDVYNKLCKLFQTKVH